jgi:hypothetical protein
MLKRRSVAEWLRRGPVAGCEMRKQEVKTSLAAMANADPKHVVQRRLAYMGVFFTLRSTAAKHGIPLADLRLVDYEVPNPQAEA